MASNGYFAANTQPPSQPRQLDTSQNQLVELRMERGHLVLSRAETWRAEVFFNPSGRLYW